MGIRKDKNRRESTEDDISQLDASGRDYVTQSEVVLAEEFGEVVKEDKKKPESTTIQIS